MPYQKEAETEMTSAFQGFTTVTPVSDLPPSPMRVVMEVCLQIHVPLEKAGKSDALSRNLLLDLRLSAITCRMLCGETATIINSESDH